MTPLALALALALQTADAPDAPPGEPDPAENAADEAPEDEAPEDEAPDDEAPDDEVVAVEGGQTIVGHRRAIRRVAGSAHTIDKETLERFEPDDVHRALRGVPGVYVRDEDGQGLRPNIGLRGASSDRSAKVVLLEDGVLFAPAPYSAPAAYYFPLTTRMVGVEVFKGPAAIRQGPHTVGGALNLRTRPVPYDPMASVDVGVGTVGPPRDATDPLDVGRTQARFHGVAGTGGDTWGVLVEAARVQSDGFKHIEGAPEAPTGFVRDDVMLKARVGSGIMDEVNGTLELKLGLQREESDETYLGLTDEDFRADPLMRYAASATDHMSWWRTQAQLRWLLTVHDHLEVEVTAYRHDLDRSWNKVNGVRGAGNLHDVLTFADAGSFPVFVAELRGQGDPEDEIATLIGPNERRFFSQGVAGRAATRFTLGDGPLAVSQKLEAGLRLHHDGITRRHSERAFHVAPTGPVDLGEGDIVTAQNRATAVAVAGYVADEVRFLDFAVIPGARLEVIRGTFVDDLRGGAPVESDQVAFLPGLGVAWQPLRAFTAIAGVHRGFSPIAPGQSADVRPEESTAVEAGARLDFTKELGLSGEAIGFFSLYENILGECTYSSGCIDDIGSQTNGGSAAISGVELLARHDLRLAALDGDGDGEGVRLRSEATYTFTHAVFLSSFDSAHPLFARVAAGDEMAYVPVHQAAFTGAVIVDSVDVGVSVGLVSQMRDVPGQGDAPATELTDPQAVVDVAASWSLLPGVRLALRVDNALDQRAIVSRRPFGARPSKPRSALISIELETP